MAGCTAGDPQVPAVGLHGQAVGATPAGTFAVTFHAWVSTMAT